ncbi:uncharacterized protein M6B38_276445 [Iris pallida]|uniref:Uncharacterized protein n=1 Tax=Iris pallida TaxID=29817 RepID=A0AAX6I385_IRIPA|nr:uncharacterized protein M6B38_276445 [Iris pallida]
MRRSSFRRSPPPALYPGAASKLTHCRLPPSSRHRAELRSSAGPKPLLFGLFWIHWDCPCRRLGSSVELSSVPTSCRHVRVAHVDSNQSRRIAWRLPASLEETVEVV